MSNIFGKGFLKVKGFRGVEKEVEDCLNDVVDLGDFSSNGKNNETESFDDDGSKSSECDVSGVKGKGSLLRLFQSDVFDSHLHMYYIYHHKEYGVHEYLVNLLYERSDGVLWYLPQLCEISMNRYHRSSLWKFLLDKSSENMNFSLILSWFYQAIQEDNLPQISENAQNMQQEIEMAVVNSKLRPDIRYIERRLHSWRESKRTSLFVNTPFDKINYGKGAPFGHSSDTDKLFEEGCNEDYLDTENTNNSERDNTKTQLSLVTCSAMPSSETIKDDYIGCCNEDCASVHNLGGFVGERTTKVGVSPSLSFPLPSCDVLPDIWIYRIVNGDDSYFCSNNDNAEDYALNGKESETFQSIKSKLDQINKQFKYLYSNNTSFAAEYDPNGAKDSSSGYSKTKKETNGFSLSSSTNIIISASNNNCSSDDSNYVSFPTNWNCGGNDPSLGNANSGTRILSSPFNQGGRVSIPYFFFTKLGSPFDLINVNNLIKEIHLKSKSRISKSISECGSDSDYKPEPCCVKTELRDGVDCDTFQIYISEIEKESETLYYLLKQHRFNYYNRINQLVLQLLQVSNFLQNNINKEHRDEILEFIMEELNLWLFYSRFSISLMGTSFLLNGLSLPMFLFNNPNKGGVGNYLVNKNDKEETNCLLSSCSFSSDKSLSSLNSCQFLRIIPEECKVFNSRKRVHFLLVIEIADLDEEFVGTSRSLVSEDVVKYLKNHGMSIKTKASCLGTEKKDTNFNSDKQVADMILVKFLNILSIGISGSMQDNDDDICLDGEVDKKTQFGAIDQCVEMQEEENVNKDNCCDKKKGWPQETWFSKIERYRKESPYSSLRSWQIKAVLLKSSDDLRQELLASQLLQQFEWIFKTSGLPLWLHPCEILVVGSHGGFIEYIQDTFSIDGLKRRFKTDNLNNCFERLFEDENERNEARKCFAQSHAAYSLVSYFLQVKDRHNGNFLIDKQGHIIQIDYGFMLGNSPGNVNFEQSPFKLTQEFLDVLLGENSSEFSYFQQLVIKGFLASRKYVDQIILTIETMSSATKLPCFTFIGTNKEYFIQEIRDRFFLHLTEEQCILRVTELVQTSINNWRSVQYDAFQRLTNGIL